MDHQGGATEREELLRRLMDVMKSPGSNVSNEEIRNILSLTQLNLPKESEKEVERDASSDDSTDESDVDELQKDENTTTVSGIKVYPRRPGAEDLGRDYEIKITALLSLRCAVMKDTKEMWLGSNVDQVGDFDDIVLCKETSEGKHLAYLIQVKHQEKPKNITQHDLVHSGKSKTGKREKSKEDFSLAKYAKGFADLMKQISEPGIENGEIVRYLRKADRIMLVLYTNKGVNKCNFLENIQDTVLSFLDTSGAKENIYKFNYSKLNYDSQFLGQLILFTNQTHLNDADKLTKQEIKNCLASAGITNVDLKKATNKFVAFVKSWAKGFKDIQRDSKIFSVLTKRDIINKLADIILDPYKLDFSKENYSFYECPKKNIWNKIICDKTMTVVDSDKTVCEFLKEYIGSEVRQYCNEPKRTWFDHLSKNTQNLFYKKYSSFIAENVEHEELTLFDIYKCLWLNSELPLLVQINNAQDYQNILKILKLNNNLHMIITKDKYVELPKTKSCKQFFTLHDLNQEDRSKVLNHRAVKLQGRPFLTLGDFTDESMYKHVKCKDIINILSSKFSVGNEYKVPNQYLIERRLSKVFLERQVLRNVKDEIFLIENFDVVDENYENVITAVERVQKCKSKGKPIHRLVYYDEQHFEWKESLGSTKNIRKFQQQNLYENMYFRDGKIDYSSNIENLWISLEDTINNNPWNTSKIISANPGTGKSILMNQIARQAHIGTWVLKINLNEHEDYYKYLKNHNCEARDHLTHFCEEIFTLHGCACETDLALAVFQKFLKNKKILVLLDGFDEISITYRDEVTKIAKSIHDEGFHLWITTRPVMKLHLEQVFDTFSVYLKPFTSENQEEFLKKYFTLVDEPSSDSKDVLGNFVQELLRAAKVNLIDRDCKFTGIPLQTQLLADVFSGEYKNSIKTGVVNFNKKFDLLYLYEEFIVKKIDILCSKFSKDAERTRVLFEEHQQIFSLKTVFDEDYLRGLNIENKLDEYCREKMQEMQFLQREGVVVLDQCSSEAKYKFNVNFIHRTFAEFLAAKWLAENFNSEDEKIENSVRTMVKSRFEPLSFNVFLFRIFDRILAKNCNSHLAVINGQLEEINLNDINAKDKSGRTVLHIIALHGIKHPNYYENLGRIEDKMVNIIEQIPNNKITDVKDDILGYNALDYALASNALAVANKICEKFPDITLNIDIPPFKKGRYFTYCVVLEYRALFKKLVPYFAARDMLIWNKSKNIIIESFCRLVEKELENQTFYEYTDELKVETISELFKFKYRDPDAAFGNYYADLRFATVFGSINNVNLLLSQGFDLNEQDLDQNTPLHYASNRGRLEAVKVFLDERAEVNKPGESGNTALHVAARNGFNKIVEELLAHGADVNSSNHESNTPIHLALMYGHLSTVNLLLLNGAKSNIVSKEGDSLLHYAAGEGSTEVISEILSRNRDALNGQNNCGCTPLHLASMEGKMDAVRLLLAEGADCNIQDKRGNSALQYAAQSGDDEIIKLLSKRAVFDTQNNDGETALHSACSRRHISTVQILLAEGAKCDIKDKKGRSPLKLAVQEGCIEIVCQLLNAGADVNSSDFFNSTPLHYSLMLGNINITKLLLDNDADISIKDKNNNTSLHYAAQAGSVEIVAELLLKGADINALTVYKNTPLHNALVYGQVDTAKLLLSKGANWDTENTHGSTPLHYAAENGCNDLLTQFLSYGLDVNKQTNDGDTALHFAAKKGHADSVRILLENSAVVDVQNIFGKTPLHVSVIDVFFYDVEIYARQKSTVRLLLDNRANANLKDGDGNTALHHACRDKSGTLLLSPKDTANILNNFYNDVVLLLVEKNADVNMRNNEGETALNLAAKAGYTGLFAILQQNSSVDSTSEAKVVPVLQTNASPPNATCSSSGRSKLKNKKKKKKHK